MKRTFKKAVSVSLVVAMLLCAAPLNGFVGIKLPNWFNFSAEAVSYNGTCGDNLTWSLDIETGLFEISGTGEMTNYSHSLVVPWKSYLSYIKSVKIGDGVTSVGDYAFISCGNLTSITIPDGVTTLGEGAFLGCESLTSVTIPDSIATIGKYAFESCTSLTSITIPDSVSTIDECTFNTCYNLENITIGKGVTTIGFAVFNECYSLTNVYYGSTEEDWNQITIGEYNEPLASATIHFTGAVVTSGTCGDNLIWTLYESGLLEITGTGEMYNWSELSNIPWLSNWRSEIKSVGIGNGVTSICDYAFSGCYRLTSVTIGNSVTTIGDYAFEYCRSLECIIIPGSVTSIGDGVFVCEDGDCRLTNVYYTGDLTSWCAIKFKNYWSNPNRCADYFYINGLLLEGDVVIPDDVTSIGDYVFGNCKSITSVTIPDGVKSIGRSAFELCEGLTNITIPESVTTIGDEAFNYCRVLASVTIPDSVTSIGEWAFSNCDQLASITIPGNVKTISKDAFFYCDNLESVTIKDGVTTIDENAFSFCYKLKTITIPDSIINIGGNAFYSCDRIQAVYYPGTPEQWSLVTVADATSTNGYFTKNIVYECNSDSPYYWGSCGTNLKWKLFTEGELVIGGTGGMNSWDDHAKVPWYYHRSLVKSITISDGVTSIGRFAFYASSNLTSVTIPDSVTTIGDYVFWWCTSLESVTISDSVTTIGNRAFFSCKSLTNVMIPDSVTTIGDEAFTWCNGLANITVDADNKYYSSDSYGVLFDKDKTTIIQYPTGNTRTSYTIPESVTTIGDNSFYDCDTLTSVTIGNSVTTIGDEVFYDCDSLKSITIPDGVTTIGDQVFYNCDSLESVTLGNSVTDIGFGLFLYCDSLKSINVSAGNEYYSSDSYGVLFNKDKTMLIQYPIGNTRISYTIPDSVTTINDSAFYSSHNLISVTIGNSVTNIGYYAFQNCTGLISITIPDSVTTIGENAFEGCTDLTSVTIGSGITFIDYWAFCDCNSLSDVYYGGTEEDWNEIYIGSDNEPLNNATIHFNYTQHNHTYKWFVESVPTATQDGLKKKICLDCGGEAESAVILATGFNEINGMVVDYADNTIYGLAPGVDSLNSYTDIVADSAEWVYIENQNGFGTGTVAKLQANGKIIGEYTIVIFGDIQGDGWYDAEDAFLVGLIVNGLLTEESLPEYMLTAADCNHDGVINELDFDLLIGAGVKMNDIDQKATQAELTTQSAYIEYASLIDQSAGMHTEIIPVPDVDNLSKDKTEPETNITGKPADGFNIEVIIANLFEFIRKIFALIFSFVV